MIYFVIFPIVQKLSNFSYLESTCLSPLKDALDKFSITYLNNIMF